MPTRTDLTDALIALIPEDGRRITNADIKDALEQEAGEPIRDAELKELKGLVVAMGAAEGVKGPGGGLKAPGVDPPPRAAAPAASTRTRRSGNGSAAPAPQAAIAPGTTAASVLTGELRNQIDRIWDAFWSGGIANPLEVLEQLTYLLFIRRLDELETLEERRSQRSGQPMRRRIFPEGADEQGRAWGELRWSRFKELGDPASMFQVVGERVFPFLRQLGGDESAYATHMRDARFTIPTPALLTKVVELLDAVPMEDRDTKGDIYEYMLGKLATAGTNGQFRTPRHIIELMVAMTEPKPTDVMVDPACGTCGFPVAVGEYLREHHPEVLSDPQLREHFNHGLFHGFDFDNTMLRIGAMNMLLHGVENPDVSYRDSLSEDGAVEQDKYTLILANPPFAGSLDYESTSGKLQRVVKTKKTELLFMALFLQLLKPGGRAAVIVPDGVLFGSSKAHKELRRTLVEDHFLEGVVSLPSGVFRPYAGVSTAILLFTKTGRGGTDQVWFYDMTADGWSLDDKRNPLLPLEKLGPTPKESLDEGEHDKNNLPDCLARWRQRKDSERDRERTAQSFCISKQELAESDYEFRISRYRPIHQGKRIECSPAEIAEKLSARLDASSLLMKKIAGECNDWSNCEIESIRKLGDICRPRQWPVLSKKEMSSSGYPVYGANGQIGFSTTYTHEHPTILIGCRGSCGTVHVTAPFSYANGNAMALDDLDTSLCDIAYLYHFFRLRGFMDVTTGSSQPQIIQQNLREIEIPLPTINAQRSVARRMECVHQQILELEKWKERLSLLYGEAGHRLLGA